MRVGFTRRLTKRVFGVSSIALLVVGLAGAPTAASGPGVEASSQTVAAVPATVELAMEGTLAATGDTPAHEVMSSCISQNICFWHTVSQGSPVGTPCRFSRSQAGNIPNVHQNCSWGMDRPVYVANDTRFRVHYYSSSDCSTGRIGSTRAGVAGTLAGTYQIRCLRFA
jgi:hypothetical protein